MDSPIVTTELGKLKGVALPKAKHKDAKQVYAYLSIPFAKPPTGNLRFKAPEKALPWDGILEANKSPPKPMASKLMDDYISQYMPMPLYATDNQDTMNEDCLYLNVYTNNLDDSSNLPVLFWIYGGGFNFGSSYGYNGQALCGLNDVVLVVPQYRVNVFGFYSLGKESSCKGNMGLWDQIMAMKWVRDNIRNFGGDPGNVTIFGESAGASSVSLHVMSPESRGLFHRAISHSGTATLPTMLKTDLSVERDALHKQLNITAVEPEEILRQLNEMDAQTIIDATTKSQTMFTPTVDDIMIHNNSSKLIKDRNFAAVPYILGMNSTEGCGLFAMGLPPTFADGLDKATALQALNKNLQSFLPIDKTEAVAAAILKTIEKEYDEEDPLKWSKLLGSVYGDSFFVAPTIEQAEAHSDAGHPTYVYYMAQQPRMHHDDKYAGKIKPKASICECDHTDDILFTFGYPFLECEYLVGGFKFSENEMHLSKQWMESLCNFAKTGNPNIEDGYGVQWPRYDSKQKRHLIIKMPYVEDSELLLSRCKLWLEIVPDILNQK